LARFAARFSCSVLLGFFLSSFLRSIPLDMTRSSCVITTGRSIFSGA
jgi:hypothetical protein